MRKLWLWLTIALGNRNPDALDETLASAIYAVIEDRPYDETSGILHHGEGVDLLPSNIELSGMETGLLNVMSREYVLRNYIDSVRKNYDYVLIDCVPSPGMMTINALAAADSVVIPSQPSFLSAKGLDLLLVVLQIALTISLFVLSQNVRTPCRRLPWFFRHKKRTCPNRVPRSRRRSVLF